jgi:hypothetical protein
MATDNADRIPRQNISGVLFNRLRCFNYSDYFESLPPWRSVSVTGVAETAPSDTVDETIRLNQYKLLRIDLRRSNST